MQYSLNLPVFVLFFAIFSAPVALADGKIGYPATVPFDESADIRQAIKDQCQLEKKLPIFLGKYLKKAGQVSGDSAKGLYLDMKITAVRAAGGGLYSGPKWMEVTGTLMSDGQPGPSFRAKRFTTSGIRACSSAQKCAKALGKDISTWAQNPVDGAELGDAK